ncbi:uncharacterized protein LOC133858173 isoform X2 [Alnus glutinosa]|uniref:uncharacterized protein LOC133858173 isoform X2 n=1 Tax=Alnus glutinosa TaxID=3517 RepID=UPI002D767F70|nr:uncharacterized protein LOC133858173 isoform X2 [Alnus glutinosa]
MEVLTTSSCWSRTSNTFRSHLQWRNATSCLSNCFTLALLVLYSIPGRYESFWKELDYVKHLWKNRQELKVEDAGIAALFGLECFAWFCAGEIVGRGFTFTGYHV